MKYIVTGLFSFLSLGLWAQGTLNPAKETMVWRNKQRIEFVYAPADSSQFHPERKEGNYRVFEYTFTNVEYSDVSDDEKTETISFQLPLTVKQNFRYRDTWLTKSNTYFLLGCFCANRGFHKVHKGEIKGRKINDTTWDITMKLSIDANQPDGKPVIKKIRGKFKLAQD